MCTVFLSHLTILIFQGYLMTNSYVFYKVTNLVRICTTSLIRFCMISVRGRFRGVVRWSFVRISTNLPPRKICMIFTKRTNFYEVKVKVTWHTTKYGDPYLEFVLCIYPSNVHTHSSEHTHTVNTRSIWIIMNHMNQICMNFREIGLDIFLVWLVGPIVFTCPVNSLAFIF